MYELGVREYGLQVLGIHGLFWAIFTEGHRKHGIIDWFTIRFLFFTFTIFLFLSISYKLERFPHTVFNHLLLSFTKFEKLPQQSPKHKLQLARTLKERSPKSKEFGFTKMIITGNKSNNLARLGARLTILLICLWRGECMGFEFNFWVGFPATAGWVALVTVLQGWAKCRSAKHRGSCDQVPRQSAIRGHLLDGSHSAHHANFPAPATQTRRGGSGKDWARTGGRGWGWRTDFNDWGYYS